MSNNINELKALIIEFRQKRDWKQFHKIKDLLLGLGIEVAELNELFLWKNEQEINLIPKEKIADEIADIFIFLTYISDEFGIDIESAVKNKVNKNDLKYLVDKSKGSNKKYNEL
ncbi:MAG: nucleotide pyrophosphohydrolase [Bacteroidetes bacterium]|nr:nucleotide pyrophosphohydrolase [Bacteroidota bacterium]